MSNSVTNTKLPNGENLNGQADSQTARSGLNQTASARVSAGQSREIFSQVNVSLGASSRNSDLMRDKEKSAPNNNNSEGEKTDWKPIKQETDSAKTSKIQGTDSSKTSRNQETDSSKTSKNPPDKDARPNNSDNREPKEQTRGSNAGKSNNAPQTAKSNDGNNHSAAKNNNQTAPQNNENHSAKPDNQPRPETSNNEKINEKNIGNQNSKLTDSGNSTKSNNETNRLTVELNYRNGGNQSQSNKGQANEGRAAADASTNVLNRGQGHDKSEQGNGKLEQSNQSSIKTPQSNPNLLKPPPDNPNPAKTVPNNQNPANAPKNAAENTPLFNNGIQRTANNTPGRNAPNATAPQTRQLNLTVNVSIANSAENNSNSHGIRQNGFLGEVISQIFRENDVYLSRNAVNALVERQGANILNRSGNAAFDFLPKEISRLIETIENQVLQNQDARQIDNKYTPKQVNIEIPRELDNQIQAAKSLFTQIFGVSDARHFSQMNIQERMLAAVEIFFKNLPAEMPENLQSNSAEKVLAGFLLARGFINSGSNVSTGNLLEMMQSAAADKVSLAAMRDFGGLVKVLISDAASAKSIANLEIAVQKFARILAAINCLDTVLTAVKLASQSQFAGGSVGRTLAIVQVYELINRLVLAGQNAMKEAAAEVAQKNAAFNVESDKNSRNVFPAKTIADLTETVAESKKAGESKTTNNKTSESKNVQAESALRKFLEFNPMFAADKFISAFENSDDARQAQNDFLNHHQIEIEQWLRSGNHRLVKDIDFEKPIGIVVERNKNDFFSATTARIVLVRDGSVQGWHFLKSFLVA